MWIAQFNSVERPIRSYSGPSLGLSLETKPLPLFLSFETAKSHAEKYFHGAKLDWFGDEESLIVDGMVRGTTGTVGVRLTRVELME